MFGLSAEQVGGLVRAILTTVAGALGMYVVTRGWLSQEIVTQISGWAIPAVVGLIVSWWSAKTKTQANIVTIASNIPGTTVVTTPALAASTPDAPKVMSSLDAKVVAQ